MDEQQGQIPDRVGEFTVIGRLARGRHSDVYLGEGPSGRVAIRVLDETLSADPVARRGFGRVIADARRATGGLPAVVADDVSADRPWAATEHVPRPTLAERVAEQGPMPESEVLGVTAGLAAVLDSLHRAGIVHGELDPSAVVLTDDGARIVGLGTGAPVDTGLIADPAAGGASDGSSVAYLAPEQLTGDRVGSPTDVFALGGLAYFAATGQPAFGHGPAPEVAARVRGDEPDLSVLDDPRLRGLIGDCLVKNRAGRPAAAEVARFARSDRDDAAVLGLPAAASGAAVGLVASCAASGKAASAAEAGPGMGAASGAEAGAAASGGAAGAGAASGAAALGGAVPGTAAGAGAVRTAAAGAAAKGPAARPAASTATASSSTAPSSTASRGVGPRPTPVRPPGAPGAGGAGSRGMLRRAVPVVLAAALVGELLWAFWPSGDDGWVPWSWPEAAGPSAGGSGRGVPSTTSEGGSEKRYAALGPGQAASDRVPAVDLRAARPARDVVDSPLPLVTIPGIPVPLVTPAPGPIVTPVPGAPGPSTTASERPRPPRSEPNPVPPAAPWRPFVTPVPSWPFVPVPTVVPSIAPVRSTTTPSSTPRPARPPAARPSTPAPTPRPTSTPATSDRPASPPEPLGPTTTPRPQRPPTSRPTSQPSWQPPSSRPSSRPPSRPTWVPNRPTWAGPSSKPTVNPPGTSSGGPTSRPPSPGKNPPGKTRQSDNRNNNGSPGKGPDRSTPRRDVQQEWREAKEESRTARQDAKQERKAAKDVAKQQRQDAKQERRDDRRTRTSGSGD